MQGAQSFERRGCINCHTIAGVGKGWVSASAIRGNSLALPRRVVEAFGVVVDFFFDMILLP